MHEDMQDARDVFAAYQLLLRKRLQCLIDELYPALATDVKRALQEPGKLLAPPLLEQEPSTAADRLPQGVWALLPLLIARHVNPMVNPASVCMVGVAVECIICALDLLDDVEDDDQTAIIHALGVPRVLNTATTLLSLAQRALQALVGEGMACALVQRLQERVQDGLLIAMAGQHRDLLDEQRSADEMTQEECLEIASWKGGALMEMACGLGALCGQADEVTYRLFCDLGLLLGTAHQLDNDSHDLYYLLTKGVSATQAGPTRVEQSSDVELVKTDLSRSKKTLPVVIAAAHDDTLQNSSRRSDDEEARYRGFLHEGIVTTWGLCLLYRERAVECLHQIEVQAPISSALRLLLGFT